MPLEGWIYLMNPHLPMPKHNMEKIEPLYKNYNFCTIIFGQSLQLLGNKVYYFCLPWYIYELTKSSLAMGTLGLIETIVPVIFGIFIGTIIDKTPRKVILIITSLMSVVTMTTLYILGNMNSLNLVSLYLFGFILSLTDCTFETAYRTSIPIIVDKHHLSKANSIETILLSIAGLIGPAIGGLLVSSIGTIQSIGFTVITGSIACFLIYFTKIPKTKNELTKKNVQFSIKNFLKDSFGGLVFLNTNKNILITTILAIVLNFGLGGTFTLLIYHARDTLNLNANQASLIFTFSAVGMLLGGLIASKVKAKLGTGKATIILGVICGICIGGLGFFNSFIIFGGLYTIATAARSCINVCFVTTLQLVSPKEKLGTIFATISSLASASFPLGIFLAGFSATFLETKYIFLTCGLIISIASFLAINSRIKLLD